MIFYVQFTLTFFACALVIEKEATGNLKDWWKWALNAVFWPLWLVLAYFRIRRYFREINKLNEQRRQNNVTRTNR